MTVTVRCRCGETFTLSGNCKNEKPLTCQNCGRALPGELSDGIRKLIRAYIELPEPPELYEIEISAVKIG